MLLDVKMDVWTAGVNDFGFACVTDVTGGWAQLNVQGPRSRELLARCTSADVSDAAFPFRELWWTRTSSLLPPLLP